MSEVKTIREGYKESALGWIPEEWEVKELSELGVFKNGINKSGEEFGTGFPLVNLNHVFASNIIDNSDNLDLVNANTNELDAYNLIEGDILFVRSSVKPAGVGLTAVIEYDLKDTVYSGFLIRFRSNKNLSKYFKRYCFYNPIFRKNLIRKSSVSANTNINQNSLNSLKLIVPPLPEQQQIAEILSTVDDKIDVIDQQITQTQELKKGLMQQLLTKGIGHTRFKDSVLGEIPEGWEVYPLAKHIVLLTGFPFKSQNFNEDNRGTKLLRGVNITEGKLRWNEKIDRWWDLPFDEFDKYSAHVGDLVISMDGSLVGRNFARVGVSDLPLLVVQRVACIRTKKSLELEFLNQIICSPLWVNYVDSVKTSSGIPHISAKNIREFKVPFPPLPEQQKIAEILSTVDDKIEVLQNKKSSYLEMKKGLMQQLLTGKTRVIL